MNAKTLGLSLLIGLAPAAAGATGDGGTFQSLRLVCLSPDRALFLEQVQKSDGGVEFTVEWSWATLDLATLQWARKPFAVSTSHMNEEGARYATGKRIPGVDFSQLFDPAGDSCIEVPLERTQVRYFRDGKKLAVELEGERETIPLAEVRGEVEALDCTADGTVCGDACEPGAACGQYAAYLLRHKKDVVLVLRVERTGEERAMFLKTNDATLAAARSRLLNDAGLKRHRQQKWREAEELFDLALAADSNNRPARYNLACAYARQGMAEASVQHLQRLVGQPKLREKIAKDPDFAPVRQTAIFKSFLEQLAAAPSGAAKP